MGWLRAGGLLVCVTLFNGACLGSEGSSLPEDIGEICSDIGSAICDRAIECGFVSAPDRLSCENGFQRSCCADDGTCGADIDDSITASEWNRCVDAFASESCPDVDNGNLPSECIGI